MYCLIRQRTEKEERMNFSRESKQALLLSSKGIELHKSTGGDGKWSE